MDVTEEKASEETRERYLGILGHDLREPLASISMTAQQLVRSGQLPAKAARTLDRITRASDRMTRMTRDLVDLARGRLGNLVAHPAAGDVGAICAAVVEEVQAVHPGRIIQLRTSGSVRCVCDRDRIAQAVTNLLSNALAYGSDPVTVTARGERDEVRVEVRNGGVLDEEERASLFEPFRRGKRTRGAKTGLGLGLYIVAQIAKAHGGSVACDAEGRETVFTIRWPRRLPAPP
jgi:signal transduction histidine kinase